MNNDVSFMVLQLSPIKGEQQIRITGKFKVNYKSDGLSVHAGAVLKHIALVVTRTANYQSVNPFKDVVVFDDDVIATESGCSGSFNFNLFDKIAFDGSGDYYIMCSIGTVTSNIIHVRFDESS
ncbi:hypothetical protein [Colwellia echini]|nr:hypothetical protein [Colwellia echini]